MVKHYVNEVGTDLVLDTGYVIATATEQYIKYKDPAGNTGSWSADLFSSYSQLAGATGTYLLKHTLESTDLTIPGEWRFHAYVGAVDGTWLGEMVKHEIFDTFE